MILDGPFDTPQETSPTFSALSLALVFVLLSCFACLAQRTPPPKGWGDFKFGLVNDGKDVYNERMKAALADNVKLEYRYAYVNQGVNPATNAYSWLFSPWRDYVKDSEAIGLRPAFVIYMLQEDGKASTLAANARNASFMTNFFTTVKLVAEKAKGHRAIFVVEPDTWGYVLQDNIDPLASLARVNDLGGDFSFLSDLPNNYSGLARAVIRTIKRYADDSYAGLLMSHWTVNASDCPATDAPNSDFGMPWWSLADIDCSVDRNIDFAQKLLGNGTDRGDFIGVEKNGHSAGYWYVSAGSVDGMPRRFYWNDQQNANWVLWCKKLGEGLNLPVLGWQISIGHPGLPNTCAPGPVEGAPGLLYETGNCAFEDTFFPYFFQNVKSFLNAGFIGFLVGKGQANDIDYTHTNKDPQMGDRGWFFQKLKEFDEGRPYLASGASIKHERKLPNLPNPMMSVGGWKLPIINSTKPPRFLKPDGSSAGQVFIEDGMWVIRPNVTSGGFYFLSLPGYPTITIPSF